MVDSDATFRPTAKWLVGLVGSLLAVVVGLVVYVFATARDDEKAFAADAKARLERIEDRVRTLEIGHARCCK